MKKQLRPILAIILTFSLALPGCKKSEKIVIAGPPPTGPVDLKLKWPVGRRLAYQLTMQQKSETLLPRAAAPLKQDLAMEQNYALKVLREMSDGGHEIEMEIQGMHLAVTANQPGGMRFDSRDKSSATNPVAATLQQLAGLKLRFFLDASNEVWKVDGVEELTKRLAGGQKDVLGIITSMFNEDYFKQMMAQNKALPGKPVQPGDRWPVQQEISLGELGQMTMEYTCNFKSWERRGEHNCARIEYTGTVKGNLQTKLGQNAGGQTMSMSFDEGKVSGDTWFDFEAGGFVDSAMNQDMKMLISVPLPPQRGAKPGAPTTQTITNLISQIVKVTPQPAD